MAVVPSGEPLASPAPVRLREGREGPDGRQGRDVAEAPRGARGAALIRDVILGGQDGLVNVLGLVLGMAVATGSTRVVVTAGLAALLAE